MCPFDAWCWVSDSELPEISGTCTGVLGIWVPGMYILYCFYIYLIY